MAIRRPSLLSILLLLAPAISSGFVSPSSSGCLVNPAIASVQSISSDGSITTTALSAATSPRRNFIGQSIFTAATILTTSPLPASAKEPPAPITRELVTETFNAIRSELTSPTGVVSTLSSLIEKGNSFDEILQYTKESDAYFRKAKMGKARKLLTDKDLKGEAILMSNAVTFDLIGINRASRPGRESKEEQEKYLEELKKDIEKFLELEKTIEVVDE